MLIKINKNNIKNIEIQNYDYEYNDNNMSLYMCGYMDAKLNTNYVLNYDINYEDYYYKHISGDFSRVVVLDKKIIVNCDVTNNKTIYYFIDEDYYYLCDNLCDLLLLRGEYEIDLKELIFFINHGYCQQGKTYFKDFLRIPPGYSLKITNQNSALISTMDSYIESVDYNLFKTTYENYIKNIVEEKKVNHNVLFSGGVDSTVILHTLRKFGANVSADTIQASPTNVVNALDIAKSQYMAKKMSVPHNIIDVNLYDANINDIKTLIKKMPLSAHFALLFKKYFEFSANKSNDIFWCGQNLDSLYNYGPTDKFSFLHRYLTSDSYLKLLSNFNGSKELVFISSLLKRYYKIFYNKDIYIPLNYPQLKDYFNNSTNYLAISSFERKKSDITKESFMDIKKNFYDNKLGTFFTGGDNQVINESAKKYGLTVKYPYSSIAMIYLFRNISRTLRDVFLPKYFVYNYSNHEAKINRVEYYKFGRTSLLDTSILSMNEWINEILTNTNLGASVVSQAETVLSRLSLMENYTFQNYISALWVSEFIMNLE